MAALNIAFEAPESNMQSRPSGGRPVDLVHLAHQTGGDKELEAEVLALFARQARLAVASLPGMKNAERIKTAHQMLGAAKGVGAAEVAKYAAILEGKPDCAATLASFSAAVIDADSFIVGLMR